jgi:signal transduction histidine kinase/CheY-like chemotaxis protein
VIPTGAPFGPESPAWRRTQTLVRARQILGAPVDLDRTLADLAEFLAAHVCDWCAIDLVEEGDIHRVVVAHADPARLPLARTLCGRFPPSHVASHGPVRAISLGRTLLAQTVEDPAAIALTDGPDHRAALAALGVRSAVCTPLVGHAGVVGAVTLVRSASRRAFTAAEAADARVIGSTAGAAVVYGRLYRELQRASQAKDQFMALLGHELRNPIGAITNAVSLMERLGAPDDAAAPARAIIVRQAEQLGRLVDDLLDVARLTARKIALQRRPVDLRGVVERCVATVRLAGGDKARDIRVDGESVTVPGDPARLEQVVGNLLDNAVKYTAPGGRILLTLRRDGGLARITVKDDGIGIAADVLPRIFELFTQAPQTLDRPQGGLGLGLALVRQLVDLHGGSVQAESAGAGRGATFSVLLPVTSATEAGVEARTAGIVPRRILIIEDHVDGREALRQLLEIDGHQVEVAGDGRAGVEAALRFRPQLVLVDIGLPGMSGYEVAQQLRGAAGNGLRLVALTGYGQAADRARAREAGFDAHLVKPVDSERLTRVLAEIDATPPPAG